MHTFSVNLNVLQIQDQSVSTKYIEISENSCASSSKIYQDFPSEFSNYDSQDSRRYSLPILIFPTVHKDERKRSVCLPIVGAGHDIPSKSIS